jgi:hypothetical protein
VIPDVPPAVRVEVGWQHRCIIDTVGQLWCWGNQDDGALGLGEQTFSIEPTLVELPGRAADLSLSSQTSCVVLEDGSAYCMGQNRYHQLGGDGPFGTPIRVEALDDIVQIASSTTHTCARRGDGSVRCWGARLHDQLGDGSTSLEPSSSDPVAPRGIDETLWVSAALEWSCAVLPSGELSCWGHPLSVASAPIGELALPTLVAGVRDVERVDLAATSACALGGGTAYCFGSFEADPFPTPRAEPIPIGAPLVDISSMAIGGVLYGTSCALDATDVVWCWQHTDNAQPREPPSQVFDPARD